MARIFLAIRKRKLQSDMVVIELDGKFTKQLEPCYWMLDDQDMGLEQKFREFGMDKLPGDDGMAAYETDHCTNKQD